MTAISIFLAPESTTSNNAFTVNLTASSCVKVGTQFFSKNSRTAFSFRPPIQLA